MENEPVQLHGEKDKLFDNKFRLWSFLFLIVALMICAFPFYFTLPAWFGIDFTKTGQIGDTIGGTMTPFIGILAAYFTFIAFWMQFKANEIQIKNFNAQTQDTQKGMFEALLFDMLKIHRENLSEISIEGHNDKIVKGREAIKYMFYELRRTYFDLQSILKCVEQDLSTEEKEKFTIVAYLIFFLGIQDYKPNNKYLNDFLGNYINSEDIKKVNDGFIERRIQDSIIEEDEELTTEKDKKMFVFYDYYAGHIHQLGHYFRHLYQLFKFIDTYSENIIPKEEKEKYARIIRSQLSNFGQFLLYYNSLSYFGSSWQKNNYIQKYRVIKNIPLPLSFGYKPEEKFANEIIEYRKDGKRFFEWLE